MFHIIFVLGSECARERKYPGAKVPGNESSRERKFQGASVPCNFRSRERKYQGTKVPVTGLLYGENSTILDSTVFEILVA